MSNLPAWERRFRAPILSFPAWAHDAPDRLVLASTESGSYQLHAWDRATGERHQVTRDPVGVLEGRPTRDGSGVIWFRDETGAESGTWVVEPFDGSGEARPLIDGLPVGWSEGLAVGASRSVAAVSLEDGFSVWTADTAGVARQIHAHPEPVRLAGGWGLVGAVDRGALSADDAVVVLEVMEDGDIIHPWLRAIDAATGATLAELRDPGLELTGFCFSPSPGDRRITITHERTGERRPAIWDTATGALRDLVVEVPGRVEPIDWWPDASAVLLLQLTDGRHRLYRYDLATDEITPLDHETGSITAAAVRPNGDVWYRVHRGEHPARLLTVG